MNRTRRHSPAGIDSHQGRTRLFERDIFMEAFHAARFSSHEAADKQNDQVGDHSSEI